MKSVLVVGGAGYIGGITVDQLLEKGHRVTVYEKLLYETRYLKAVNFIYGDVRDTNKLLEIHKQYDSIIWLAAIVGDGACAQDPELTRAINVDALANFLSIAKRRVIFTSTCSVYGAQDGILTESSPTNPLSVYATTKLEAEKHVLDHGGLVFRLGTLFGLGDLYSRIRLDLVVNILTLRAYRDHHLTVFGGEQWRPLLAVRDVASYLVEAINKEDSEIFNLKYKNYKMLDLANEIMQIFPQAKLEVTDMKFEDLRNYQADTTKAEKRFTFQPKTSISSEVKKMSQLFIDHRIKDPNADIYYNALFVKNLVKNGNGKGEVYDSKS